MKMQALREVQEKLKNEMARRRRAVASGNESRGSYRTAYGNGVSPSHPPGLAIAGTSGVPVVGTPGIPVVGTPGVPVVVSGEALSERPRTLELPKLTECSALEFGDWMAVITPLMSDLNSTSATSWELTVSTAKGFYDQWRVAAPVDRLRLQVQPDPGSRRYPRTEQRAVKMLLVAVPEQIRRDIGSSQLWR